MAEDKNKDQTSKVEGTNIYNDKAVAQLVKKATNMVSLSESRGECDENENTAYYMPIGSTCMANPDDYTIQIPIEHKKKKNYKKNSTVDLSITYKNEKGENESKVLTHEVDENGRLKLLPNATYVLDGVRYQTDEYARVVMVVAKIKPKPNEKKGNVSKAAVGDHETAEVETDNGIKIFKFDDNGHIIGFQLGGADNPINLVAQYANLNRGAYLQMEDLARDVCDAENSVNGEKKPVYMAVQLTYSDNKTTRPNGYLASIEVGGENDAQVLLTKRFFNDNVNDNDRSHAQEAYKINQETLNRKIISKKTNKGSKKTSGVPMQKQHDVTKDVTLFENSLFN